MSDAVPYDQDFVGRFWSRVAVAEAGCWLWTRGKDRHGYGAISYRRKMLKAHRVAWELSFGKVPDGAMVCHRCDTPACARPSHLFAGSAAMNSADMVAKGRASHAPRATGERNGGAEVTVPVVRYVRALVESGMSQSEAGRRVGLSVCQVGNIVHRRHWKDA